MWPGKGPVEGCRLDSWVLLQGEEGGWAASREG